MRLLLMLCVAACCARGYAQGTVPVFTVPTAQGSLTVAGHAPGSGSTTFPTVLVPVTLTFSQALPGAARRLDASPDTAAVLHSPLFGGLALQGATQFGDALLRANLAAPGAWHTLLGPPHVHPLTVAIPPGYGYVLFSKRSGRSMAVVDSDYLVKQIFARLGKQAGLVIAFAHNTTYYVDADATDCCTWGAHGVDPDTGTSFVLGSYLAQAPAIVTDQDIQPLSEQLGEYLLDPLHNPFLYGGDATKAGNVLTAWRRPLGERGCGGRQLGTAYYSLEPTDTNTAIDIPSSPSYVAQAGGRAWHLQNIALLPWYTGPFAGAGRVYSFPDAQVLTQQALPCVARHHHDEYPAETPGAEPLANATLAPGHGNGHALIGYYNGYRTPNGAFTLRDVAAQWDVVIVAFAHPAGEGALRFHPPLGETTAQFRDDIAYLKRHGHKVLISLGGGGAYFRLDEAGQIPNFVHSVEDIVSTYGFNGIDLDFETPSLALAPGDTDYRHPTTPSIVNLIQALHTLHDHFGSGFMISLVPEGTQIPGGLPSYGGQFGSYLPLTYAIRDILSFVDVQDYNTPPLEGLDNEIYQVGSADYDAAMTELELQGFHIAGRADQSFPPLPPGKVAIGFLAGYTTATHMQQAMRLLIEGKAPSGEHYTLHQPGGYPSLLGAMLWTIDDDRRDRYAISNSVGPLLHDQAAVR